MLWCSVWCGCYFDVTLCHWTCCLASMPWLKCCILYLHYSGNALTICCVFAVCSSPAKVLACCGDMQPGQGWCPRLVFKQPGHGVIVLVGVEMAIGAMLFVGENLVWWYHVIVVEMACWCHVDCVVAACVVFFFQVVALMLCFTMMCPLLSSSLLKYSYVCWSEFSAVDIGNID